MKEKVKLTTPEAREHFKVTSATLRRWHKLGQIEVERNPSGHRRYIISIDVPDEDAPETLPPQEIKVKQDARRKEIEAELAENKADLTSENSLLADYAKFNIPMLEQKLKDLS